MVQFEVNESLPHFTILGTFPSFNEYQSACRRNPYVGNSMKKKCMRRAEEAIAFSPVYRYRPQKALVVHFVYYESNKRRDKDNIDSMCRKVVFDALQECGVIENDGWKQIDNYTHDFYVDASDPRIEVYLEEVENG